MLERMSLVVEVTPDGRSAKEEVLVEREAPGRYRLASAPGFLLGLAVGDVFDVLPDGRPRVLVRGGNLCIQFFCESDATDMVHDLEAAFAPLRGKVDGVHPQVLVVTVSIGVGFPAIQSICDAFVNAHQGVAWYYANVYDPVDGVTPLNWW